MTALQTAQGVASYLALAWMLYQLARRPRDVRLRAVTGLVGCWAVAYPFGLAADRGAAFAGLEPMACRLVEHALLLVAAYSLMCFYLLSALDARAARVRALRQTGPLAVAVLVLVVATLTIPPEIRVAAATLPAGPHDGPAGVSSVAVFYLTANLYMLYAFANAWVWTRRYARLAEPRLRRGLLVASVGLAAIVPGIALFVVANIIRWAGGVTPPPVIFTGIFLLLPGVLLFLAGVSYPAAMMRLAALRIWWRHRRMYHRLGPLWMALHAAFPEDALGRVPAGPLREALSVRGVHRRYYRRVIECRDGLVRISPYLARYRIDPGADASTLASRLKDALRAHAEGEPVPPQAMPVAIPQGDGLDADVHELVALARALRGVRRDRGSSALRDTAPAP